MKDAFIYTVLLYIFIIVPMQAMASPDIPRATKGVLDLSSWDFDADGSVTLTGEWEFYWKQLLTPDDFFKGNGNISGVRYVYVPKSWTSYKKSVDENFSRHGYATYRLRLKGSLHFLPLPFSLM